MTITDAERAVLEQLAGHWPSSPMVVIGAAALRWQLGMGWRVTMDIDLTVAIEVDELATLRSLDGWRRDPRNEQRWLTSAGQRVDVIPAAPRYLTEGRVAWPETGAVMDVSTLDLAFSCNRPMAGLPAIAVATLPAIAVLKMASFLDRRHDREHDLGDIAHILDGFLGLDDDRRWHDPAIDPELAFDLVSPFATGLALSDVLTPSHRALIDRFMSLAMDPASPVHARMQALAPMGWRDGSSIEARLQAFVSGLER